MSMPSDKITREPDEGSEGGSYDVMESAAEDMLAAIKSGDAKALAEALKSALELHESNQGEEQDV